MKDKKAKRFERVFQEKGFCYTEVLVDTETGVNYLFHSSGYAGGLTPLLDKDGNVVITPVEEK